MAILVEVRLEGAAEVKVQVAEAVVDGAIPECEKLPPGMSPANGKYLSDEQWSKLTSGQKRTWNLLKNNKVLQISATSTIDTTNANGASTAGAQNQASGGTPASQAGNAFGNRRS